MDKPESVRENETHIYSEISLSLSLSRERERERERERKREGGTDTRKISFESLLLI